MSEQVGEAVIVVRTDEAGVDYDASGRRAGEGYTKGFTSSLKGIAVAIGGVLAARKALDFVKQSVAEAREAQKVGAATEQIIKSTGASANVTAKEVADLAGSLSLATGMDDELIQSGQNLILTFKNVRNEGEGLNAIFDRTTRAAADLSAAGFGSMQSASLQLGKALNDPIRGISALSRSGVTFTEVQKEQIKGLVESGDLLSAQKIILAEVESQVGGVAEATATSGEKATTAWNNVKEAVGTALLPVLDRLLDMFSQRIAPALITVAGNASALGPLFDSIADGVQRIFAGEGAAGGFLDTVRELAATVLPMIAAAFAALLPYAQEFLVALQAAAADVLPVLAATFQDTVLPALQSLGEYLIANVLPVLGQFAQIIINDVVPTLVDLATFLYGSVYPAIVSIVTAIAERLKPVFDTLLQVLRDSILPTIRDLVRTFREDLLPVLQPIVEKILAVVGVVLKLAAAILGQVLPPLLRLAGFIIERLVPVIAKMIEIVVKVIGKVFDFGEGIVNFVKKGKGIIDFIGSIVDAVKRLIGWIGDAIDGFLELLGLKAKAGDVTVTDRLRDYLNRDPGFTTPSEGRRPGRNARGTDYWRGGMTWVGEEGPELVSLPRGSQIRSAPESAAVAGGTVINIGTLMPHNYSEFTRQIRDEKRAAGLGGRRPVMGG